MKSNVSTIRRHSDHVDTLLSMWILAFVILVPYPNRFLAGYALLLLVVALLFRRALIPGVKREIQLASAMLLCWASASAVTVGPVTPQFFKALATNLLLLVSWLSANELLRRPFRADLILYFHNRDAITKTSRQLFERPGVCAVVVAVWGVAIQTSWITSPPIVVFSPWLIPFVLNFVLLRRATQASQGSELLYGHERLQPFGGSGFVLLGCLATSATGFTFEFFFPQNPILWAAVTLVLALQALAIIELNRSMERARQRPGEN